MDTLVLVLFLEGKLWYSKLNEIVSCGFCIQTLYHDKEVPFYSWLTECFYHVKILNFVTCPVFINWIILCLPCPSVLFMLYNTLAAFPMLNHPCMPGVILFGHVHDPFNKLFFLRCFITINQKYCSVVFCSCGIFLSDVGSTVSLASFIFWKCLSRIDVNSLNV